MTAEADSFSALIAAFHAGRLCPVDYTESLIARIKSRNPSLRAFISLTETTARAGGEPVAAAAEVRTPAKTA